MTERKTATIVVTWDAEYGGRLNARCADSPTLSSNTVRWTAPITASTDSWEIAHAVTELTGAPIISVDHDGDTVFVEVDDTRTE